MAANDKQIGGDHYQPVQVGAVQHWDFCAAYNLDYFQGVITKYVTRWKKKNGLQDLEKAKHYLEKYIELERSKIEQAGAAGDSEPGHGYVRQD